MGRIFEISYTQADTHDTLSYKNYRNGYEFILPLSKGDREKDVLIRMITTVLKENL